MGRRRYNPRLAKIHRSYTIREVCDLFEVHPNTVRHWLARGLSTIDSRRPTLVRGRDLRDFLQAQRRRRKRPCADNEIFCVACQMPKIPAEEMADFEPATSGAGRLVGLCPTCGNLMYRRINTKGLARACEHLTVCHQTRKPGPAHAGAQTAT